MSTNRVHEGTIPDIKWPSAQEIWGPDGPPAPTALQNQMIDAVRKKNGQPLNTSGIHPLTRRVLVLRDAVEERTKGGIILPDSEVEKQKWATVNGTLIAAGPLAWAEDRHDAALYGVDHGIPEPGARVKVGKYTGDNHEGADGKLYTLMNDTDVLAVLT